MCKLVKMAEIGKNVARSQKWLQKVKMSRTHKMA